jgi:hypothetical protein
MQCACCYQDARFRSTTLVEGAERAMNKIPKSGYIAMVALFTMCFCMESVDIQAATFYVATTGSDGFPGTGTQPFRTIARGVSSLKVGDTLYIRAGTYSENIDSNKQTIPTGTSWTDAPLIAAYPGETVILTGNINLAHSYIQYVRFERLVLNGGFQNIGVGNGAHHVKFADLEVKNGAHQCIQYAPGSHHIWFTGGSVHDCGLAEPVTNAGYAFYVSTDDNIIENTTVYNVNSFCIHIYDSNLFPSRNIVRNTVLHHCGAQKASSSAILLSRGDSNLAYNNIVYSTSGHGIMISSGSNVKIYNNTLYGGAQTGVYVQSLSKNAEVRNNISYLNATTQILDQGSGTIVSKNLTSEPRFFNATALDFRLQTSSPAIDGGETLTQVNNDVKGTPRPQGATHDIGAYEGGATSVSLSPPKNLRVQ